MYSVSLGRGEVRAEGRGMKTEKHVYFLRWRVSCITRVVFPHSPSAVTFTHLPYSPSCASLIQPYRPSVSYIVIHIHTTIHPYTHIESLKHSYSPSLLTHTPFLSTHTHHHSPIHTPVSLPSHPSYPTIPTCTLP